MSAQNHFHFSSTYGRFALLASLLFTQMSCRVVDPQFCHSSDLTCNPLIYMLRSTPSTPQLACNMGRDALIQPSAWSITQQELLKQAALGAGTPTSNTTTLLVCPGADANGAALSLPPTGRFTQYRARLRT